MSVISYIEKNDDGFMAYGSKGEKLFKDAVKA